MRLRERLGALATTEAAQSVAMFTEALAFGTAVVARQFGLELSSGQMHNGSGPTIQSFGFGLRLNPASSSNYLPGFDFVAQPRIRPQKHSTLFLAPPFGPA
jgi:hypothetical protein